MPECQDLTPLLLLLNAALFMMKANNFGSKPELSYRVGCPAEGVGGRAVNFSPWIFLTMYVRHCEKKSTENVVIISGQQFDQTFRILKGV